MGGRRVIILSMWRAVLTGLVVVCLLGYGCSGGGEETYQDEETGLVHVPEEDPEMDAAIAEAKRTIDEFIGHFQSPKPGMSMFAVKKPYPTRGGTEEHIWVEVTEYRGGSFHGTIGNEPVDIEGITLGTPVIVAKSEITDWLIVTDGEPLGGFTVAVLDKRVGDQ